MMTVMALRSAVLVKGHHVGNESMSVQIQSPNGKCTVRSYNGFEFFDFQIDRKKTANVNFY